MRANTVSVLTFVCSLLLCACFQSHTQQEAVSEQIRERIPTGGMRSRIVLIQDTIYASETLYAFYKDRSYRPAWSVDAEVSAQADSLVTAIREADREGLTPGDYHLAAIESMINELRQNQENKELPVAARLADLDLLLSDAFLVYASHVAEGKVDRETLHPDWSAKSDSLDYAKILDAALQSDQIARSLQDLLPHHGFYRDLREMLSSFEATMKKGGWERVPDGLPMSVGNRGKRALALGKRLAASGDLTGSRNNGSDLLDSTLEKGLRRFQRRHGLDATGVLDSATLVALNVPVEGRLDQIRVNLERWRWLPRELSKRYVQVNVADFKLTVVEDSREVLGMRVVVGNPDWQTPVLSTTMTQVLFNDFWIAPHHIVATELINYMKADSEYLRRNKMVLLRGSGDSVQEVDPRTINFAQLNAKDIDFRLRQDPGPDNIMGQVKFLLPNKHDVFLHETPYREDFGKNVRMYSHGCIRLEKPYEFAQYLLRDYPGWTKDTIFAVVQRGERRTVNLKDKIPVYVLYCTAWRENDGTIQFREDYYGRDRQLSDALREAPRVTDGPFLGRGSSKQKLIN